MNKVMIGDSLPVNKPPDKKKIKKRIADMYAKREDWVKRWKEIRDYQLPFLGEFDDTADKSNPARRKDTKILSGVAWRSAQVFSAGVMSGLTPPSRQWFKFSIENQADNLDVQEYLDECQKIQSSVMARSNFYNAVHSVYQELPFGQCPMCIFEDVEKGIKFVPMTIGTYALDTDGYGKIEYLASRCQLTLRQIVERFGEDALPAKYANWQNKPNEKYNVYWLVEPNEDALPDYIGRLNMPYKSIYYMDGAEDNEYLYVGGFEEFPAPTARYIVTGSDVYGKGPGWFAEGDSKALGLLKKDYLSAVELQVKPPMKAPQSLINAGINLIPGSATPVDEINRQFVEPMFNVNLDLNHISMEIQKVEDSIKDAYSANLFLMLDSIDSGRMTAQ